MLQRWRFAWAWFVGATLITGCGLLPKPEPPEPPPSCEQTGCAEGFFCSEAGTCNLCDPDLREVGWAHKQNPPAQCSTPELPVKHQPPGDKCPSMVAPCAPPELPEPQCETFTDRGGTFRTRSGQCDCYFGTVWTPCPEPPDPTSCTFPQGIPDGKFTHFPDAPGTLGSVVNATMADLTGCTVGSDCPITFAPDTWMAIVCARLCEKEHDGVSLNCGRHRNTTPGGTDQISVKPGSFCDGGAHQQFQIYNYGGGKIRWAPGGSQGSYTVECVDGPTPPPGGEVCADPNPRGLPARFDCHRVGNGNKITCTYKITEGRSYCDQVCSPIEPDVCYTGRNACPVRIEGDPERVPCERDPEVIGEQQWWCEGQPNNGSTENPAQSICSGAARTCTEDGATCADIPPK